MRFVIVFCQTELHDAVKIRWDLDVIVITSIGLCSALSRMSLEGTKGTTTKLSAFEKYLRRTHYLLRESLEIFAQGTRRGFEQYEAQQNRIKAVENLAAEYNIELSGI